MVKIGSPIGWRTEAMHEPQDDTKTILIVGDPALSRSLMQLVLNKLHYAVCCASTAAEARRAARCTPFALVLVALNLPDGSGLELGGWLRREIRALDGIPILVFGDAWDEARARDACKEAGLQGYLAKPLSIGRLLGTIRELTQQGGGEAAEPERPLPFHGHELMAPPMDLDRLAEIADGDRQLIVEIGSLYLATAARYLEEMRQALDSDPELRRLAHALKGASRNVGADRVAELAEAAERNGIDAAGLVRLERQVEEVRQFFEETLGAGERSGTAG